MTGSWKAEIYYPTVEKEICALEKWIDSLFVDC